MAGYVAAFWLLSVVLVRGMPVGVAYAIWSAFGVATVALLASWLFGLGEGAEALRAGAVPVIVEGPMDAHAITLASGGVVGRARVRWDRLTEAQVAALADVVPLAERQIAVATAADTAGRKAAGRAWQLLRGAGAPDLGTEKNPAALLENGGPGAVDGTSTRARRCWTALTANRPAARGRADDRRA